MYGFIVYIIFRSVADRREDMSRSPSAYCQHHILSVDGAEVSCISRSRLVSRTRLALMSPFLLLSDINAVTPIATSSGFSRYDMALPCICRITAYQLRLSDISNRRINPARCLLRAIMPRLIAFSLLLPEWICEYSRINFCHRVWIVPV
jgi:hypothetical protein